MGGGDIFSLRRLTVSSKLRMRFVKMRDTAPRIGLNRDECDVFSSSLSTCGCFCGSSWSHESDSGCVALSIVVVNVRDTGESLLIIATVVRVANNLGCAIIGL